MCIIWCADGMTVRNARCNDKDREMAYLLLTDIIQYSPALEAVCSSTIQEISGI